MNLKQRQQYTINFLIRVQETLDKKGNDYASIQDPFSNFKNSSQLLKIPVEKVFLNEITKKISRIVELLEKEAKNESIMDSVLDIAGYTCLLDNYLRGVADDKIGNQEAGQLVGETS
jgi:hypothetical protein